MEVDVAVSHEIEATLAGELSVAAKQDADKLKKMIATNPNLEFSSSLADVGKNRINEHKKVKVSQAFFQRAFAYRMAVCNLERQIKQGTIKGSHNLEVAEQGLIDLSIEFGKIRDSD